MAVIRPMMATTTIISMSVTPRHRSLTVAALKAPSEPRPLGSGALLVLPTDDIGIQSFAAGLAIAAETDDIRLVAMLARKLVNVVVGPGVFGDILRHIRPIPLVGVRRFHAQGDQTLFRGREYAGIQFVGAQGRHEAL